MIVAGIFNSPQRAQRAATALRRTGLTSLNLLVPGTAHAPLGPVQKSETEPPGMDVASTVLIPGVGPVLALGAAATALFGVAGMVTAVATGAALQEAPAPAIPADDLYIYKDALRKGKPILFVLARDADDADRANSALAAAGAESIDAARENLWLSLRNIERQHYTRLGGDFEKDEYAYRRGFEAALAQQADYPDSSEPPPSQAFQSGYQRGIAHRRVRRA
jgi:hypothetical protein